MCDILSETLDLQKIDPPRTLCHPREPKNTPVHRESQSHFNFDADPSTKGYTQWLTSRKIAAQELARRMGLPLGHEVEVWLSGGIRLKGILRLREELIFLDEER